MSVEELLAQLIFSASGKEVRIFYTTVGTEKVIEYVGLSNSPGVPTSAARWFITKLEYDGTADPVRIRGLSIQNVLDDRASLFP